MSLKLVKTAVCNTILSNRPGFSIQDSISINTPVREDSGGRVVNIYNWCL